jgi:hypothetical protein
LKLQFAEQNDVDENIEQRVMALSIMQRYVLYMIAASRNSRATGGAHNLL